MREGAWRAAEAEARRLADAEPGNAEAFFCLGTALLVQGASVAAINALLQATALEGKRAHYWDVLFHAQCKLKYFANAEQTARRALQIDASRALHWANLGHALYYLNRWEEAAATCQRALEIDPRCAAAWDHLGAARSMLGQLADAETAYRRAIEEAPQERSAKLGLARVLRMSARPREAVELLQALLPSSRVVEEQNAVWLELGRSWQLVKDWGQAEDAFQHARRLVPQNLAAYRGIVECLLRRFELTAAEDVSLTMIREMPDCAEAWNVRSKILQASMRANEAQAASRRSLELECTPAGHSAALCGMHYRCSSPAELLAAHQAWNLRHVKEAAGWAQPGVLGDRSRPLSIGLCSADFGQHPVSLLAVTALEELAKLPCSVVCYFDGEGRDFYTERFRGLAATWRETRHLSHRQLAQCMRDDELDVLIDLMGHTGPRLEAFALKPAPVQISWLGYVGTTGLAAMDYLLADGVHVRAGEESYYQEAILRMPHGYACFAPPAGAPEVGPLPARRNGYVTFGSFNNPAKYSVEILSAWAEIIRRVRDARLLLKFGGLQDRGLQERVLRFFAERDVSPGRIRCEGWSDPAGLLAAYGEVDLALDTQPYSGGVTTCEALWMGAPVVTFPGATFAGRHAASHLMNAGFSEFIASDVGSYVALAVSYAERPEELAALRASMRRRVRESPLCDAKRFAGDLLDVLREAVRAKR